MHINTLLLIFIIKPFSDSVLITQFTWAVCEFVKKYSVMEALRPLSLLQTVPTQASPTVPKALPAKVRNTLALMVLSVMYVFIVSL